MGGHAPASDDFIVILADAFAGKNALLPATAPLLAAARPMRAAVTPRPEPATARLAMDMQREADIVTSGADGMADVHARSGTKTPKPRPEIKKMKRLTRARVRWYRSRFGFGTSRARNKHFCRVTERSFRRPSAS